MGVGEIIFYVFLFALVGFVIVSGVVCAVVNEVRLKRYDNFYKTTDLGKELLTLLETMTSIRKDIESDNETLKVTAEQIDEIESYYPNEAYYVKKANSLKWKYLETKKQLAESEECLATCNIRLDKLMEQLPKKYKDALNYI